MVLAVFRGLLGVAIILGMAVALSPQRRRINWRIPAAGVTLQFVLAFLFIRDVPGVRDAFQAFAGAVVSFLDYGLDGARFVFGALADRDQAGAAFGSEFAVIFAFQILPIIVFFSAFTSILYYLGVLQWFVYGFAWLMKKVMPLSGPESLAVAANVFLGQTEAPLLVKPYLGGMNRSELMAMMTGGMATIAGSVMMAYIGMLGGDSDAERSRFAGYLLCASLMNAPAALVIAKMLVPQTESITGEMKISRDEVGINLLDAVTRGASQGLKLALNVAAMLIVFVALIALLNGLMRACGGAVDMVLPLNDTLATLTGGVYRQFDLEALFGMLFSPVAWAIGIPSGDLLQVGQLLGKKMIANEFLAFLDLAALQEEGALSPRAVFIATFALCGFANFSSIGIQIGGIGVLASGQRDQLARLGLKAMIGGTLASLLSASIAGIFFAGG